MSSCNLFVPRKGSKLNLQPQSSCPITKYFWSNEIQLCCDNSKLRSRELDVCKDMPAKHRSDNQQKQIVSCDHTTRFKINGNFLYHRMKTELLMFQSVGFRETESHLDNAVFLTIQGFRVEMQKSQKSTKLLQGQKTPGRLG